MKRFSLISAASIILIFIAGLTTPTLVWPSPGIVVVPSEHNFGEVELGTSSTTIITISNTSPGLYYIDAVSFQAGSSSDFSITMAPPSGTVLLPGESVDVEVTYTPSALGDASAVLDIAWINADTGVAYVSLGGVGVGAEPPPPVSIAEILAFIDESVANGSLVGTGPGKSAVRRLNALRNQIEAAGDLIEDGLIEEACHQLMVAYTRADGLVPPGNPPDFVAGYAASDLAVMIMNLRISLGCG